MNEHASRSEAGCLVRTDRRAMAFVPNPLPPSFEYRGDLVELLDRASDELGGLRGIGMTLAEDVHLLLRPYMYREAVASSRIEGTQSTLSDLYLHEADPGRPAPHADVREVINYTRAMSEGLQTLKHLPLSLRFVRQLHETLMTGVRGKDKSPGEFRRIQNWIGPDGASIQEATYIPPPVPEMLTALDRWEKFLHARQGLPVLLQCAMMHYQFEAIHPFLDGNGRVGRLMIPLFLCDRRRLSQPLLYLSAYFVRNRQEYYDCLLGVSQRGDWMGWFIYFLRGVASQARLAVRQADIILALRESYRQRLLQENAPTTTLKAVDNLFQNPYVTVKRITEVTETTQPTAQAILNRLEKAGIVTEITGKRWRRIYCAKELLRKIEEPPEEDENPVH